MIEEPDSEGKRRPKGPWVRALELSIYLILGSCLFTFATMNNFFVSRCGGHPTAKKNACISNLMQIQGAKHTWAFEWKKPAVTKVTDGDLFGTGLYLRDKPQCPSGGSYSLRRTGQKPRCSVLGHTL
jgi:hypothetical protein